MLSLSFILVFYRFACPDPLIKVKTLDQLPLFCPRIEVNNFVLEIYQRYKKLSENLYYVDEEHFRSCNATGKIYFLYKLCIH